MNAAHQKGDKAAGLDLENSDGGGVNVKDACSSHICDLYLSRYWGIKLATHAATTVLRVDQVRYYISSYYDVFSVDYYGKESWWT